MNRPTFSIVMPSFNQDKYLEQAIRSVLDQDYPHRELIVMDGGSKDSSRQIIEQYDSRIAHWVSEPDKGQSDALNRGFAAATGDLLTWLNSDDILLPGSLSAVARQWHKHGEPNWLAGNCVWTDPQGRIIRCVRNAGWSDTLAAYGMVNVSGPTSFFARTLLERVGPLDEDLHYAMDSELWLRFANAGERYVRVPEYLWALRLHPEAKMSGHNFADSPMADPNHPVHRERREQWASIDARYSITPAMRKRGKYWSRLIRGARLATPRALMETRRYRGKMWSEVFGSFDATTAHA